MGRISKPMFGTIARHNKAVFGDLKYGLIFTPFSAVMKKLLEEPQNKDLTKFTDFLKAKKAIPGPEKLEYYVHSSPSEFEAEASPESDSSSESESSDGIVSGDDEDDSTEWDVLDGVIGDGTRYCIITMCGFLVMYLLYLLALELMPGLDMS